MHYLHLLLRIGLYVSINFHRDYNEGLKFFCMQFYVGQCCSIFGIVELIFFKFFVGEIGCVPNFFVGFGLECLKYSAFNCYS